MHAQRYPHRHRISIAHLRRAAAHKEGLDLDLVESDGLDSGR
jgi:hypothetical protein